MDSADSILKDITPGQEKPLWPLTSYGPAKYQPALIAGLDESLEELRARAATALKAGTIEEYVRSFLPNQSICSDVHLEKIRSGEDSSGRWDVRQCYSKH